VNEEELMNITMKNCILNKWKDKISYPLSTKDIDELEQIIDFYEQINQQLQKINEELKEDLEKSIKVQIKANKTLIEIEKWINDYIYTLE